MYTSGCVGSGMSWYVEVGTGSDEVGTGSDEVGTGSNEVGAGSDEVGSRSALVFHTSKMVYHVFHSVEASCQFFFLLFRFKELNLWILLGIQI